MYQTLEFAPVLDYAQEARNISDNMLGRPYNPVQRCREQQVEQDYTRYMLNKTFPMQEQERIAYYQQFQTPIEQPPIEPQYVQPIVRNVYASPQFPKWPVQILVTIVAIIILSLVLGIVAIIALLKRK
jgi:hypothetical protein